MTPGGVLTPPASGPDALAVIAASGEAVTPTAVARRAGVWRQWLYTFDEALEAIHAASSVPDRSAWLGGLPDARPLGLLIAAPRRGADRRQPAPPAACSRTPAPPRDWVRMARSPGSLQMTSGRCLRGVDVPSICAFYVQDSRNGFAD